MSVRGMASNETLAALSLAKDFHAGRIDLPSEIKEIYVKIEDAKRRAVRFAVIMGVVDMSLINEAVALMLEKDRLYSEWARAEARGMV